MRAHDNRPLTGQAGLEVLSSPARLEILSALADGPTSTEELAERLGRSRPSLYYHLALLEQLGLVATEAPAAGERERLFRLTSARVAVATRRKSAQDRKAGAKAIQAILRITAREATTAMEDPATRVDGALRQMVGVRGKARLSDAELRRVNRLIDQLTTLLMDAKEGAPTDRLYALTLVLTPAREAGKEKPE
jgi:DNA-binding transcriptional ArsR family regulator